MRSFYRRDFGMRKPVVNCLLSALLFLAAVGFLSCYQERLVVYDTPQMAIEKQFWVRVLLAERIEQCTLKVKGQFSVLDAAGQALVPETIFDRYSQSLVVKVSAAGLNIAGRNFAAMQATILPDEPHIFSLDNAEYRGKVLIKVNSDYTTFDVVNIVPLESYLAGVVTAEMPSYWQPESLNAQAIAARTYCLYNNRKFQNQRHWDVKKTTESQVYLGIRGETAQSWKAVNTTWGQVIVCSQAGGDVLFPAYYSSSCGGHTENAENVFGDSFPSLSGADCPYCKDVAKPSVFFWPMAQFDKVEVVSAVQAKYPKLKSLVDIESIVPAKQSDYPGFSRLTLVKLTDSKGKSDFLRAEDLRLTIDPTGTKLRSTSCKIINLQGRLSFISGRGFGHGVGMCQCGAEGMARRGKSASDILSHYYPGSKLTRIY